MDSNTKATILGALIGSLVEEIAEAAFPGLGELELLGETIGGLVGAAVEHNGPDAKRHAARFLKFAYRALGGDAALGEPNPDEVRAVFEAAPAERRLAILMKFKEVDPAGYRMINDWVQA